MKLISKKAKYLTNISFDFDCENIYTIFENHMLNCKKRIILYTWLFDPDCKLNKYTLCEIFKILESKKIKISVFINTKTMYFAATNKCISKLKSSNKNLKLNILSKFKNIADSAHQKKLIVDNDAFLFADIFEHRKKKIYIDSCIYGRLSITKTYNEMGCSQNKNLSNNILYTVYSAQKNIYIEMQYFFINGNQSKKMILKIANYCNLNKIKTHIVTNINIDEPNKVFPEDVLISKATGIISDYYNINAINTMLSLFNDIEIGYFKKNNDNVYIHSNFILTENMCWFGSVNIDSTCLKRHHDDTSENDIVIRDISFINNLHDYISNRDTFNYIQFNKNDIQFNKNNI